MKKWMNKYLDNTILELAIPGTHNSAITKNTLNMDNPLDSKYNKWYINIINYLMPNAVRYWTVNQQLNIKEQLIIGVRYIELKLSVYNNDIYVSHSYQGPSLDSVLDLINDFYTENGTSEVIVLLFKVDYENKEKFNLQNNKKLLSNKIKNHQIFNYITNINNPLNTKIKDFKDSPIILILDDNLYIGEIGYNFYSFNIYDKWFNTNNEDKLEDKINEAINSDEYKNSSLKILQNILTPDISNISQTIILGVYLGVNILYLCIIFIITTIQSYRNGLCGFKNVIKNYIIWIILLLLIISWPIYYFISKPSLGVLKLSEKANQNFIKNIPQYNNINIVMVDNIDETFVNKIIKINET